MNSPPEIPDLRWVLRYSAIAYFVVVLWQCSAIVTTVPKFPQLFAQFGADLPSVTVFIIRYYWLGCAVVAAVSLISACFLFFNPDAAASYLKFSYVASLVALIGSFVWAGFALDALYAPIFALSTAI